MGVEEYCPTPPFENPAIVYKPIETYGGLEQYVAELSLALDAPIYTPSEGVELETPRGRPNVIEFGSGAAADWLLNRLPVGTIKEMLEYENFCPPSRYDAIITVSETAKAVIHRPDQRRYHMLNMPPRWLYDQGRERFDGGGIKEQVKRVYQSYVRMHDSSTIPRIDDFVVPSEVIGRRLSAYYDRKPLAVIYPPIDTDRYRYESRDGFLLYIGRLSVNKRVTEIVEALSETSHCLKVAGEGPELEKINQIAGSNIETFGFVSDEKKRDLLARCDAVVFNSNREAFGIVPIEAFASGKPVVGIDEGYTSYQIDPDVNGVLYSRGVESLLSAVDRTYELEWDSERIQRTAEPYDISEFRSEWQALIYDTE